MFIYKITNTCNGKIYIGKTIRSIQERWKRHVNDAISERLDTYLSRAIRKYGESAFVIESIDSDDDKQSLAEKEKYWIRYYNSDKVGYNMTAGGDGDNTYARKQPCEMELIKDKIRKTKLGDKNPNARPYKCKNIKTGEELHFRTAKECMEYFGEGNHNFVTQRALHKISYLFRGEWQIAYETEEYDADYTTYKHNRKGHQLRIINTITSQIYDFSCYTEAERELSISRKVLSQNICIYGTSPWIKDHYIIVAKAI